MDSPIPPPKIDKWVKPIPKIQPALNMNSPEARAAIAQFMGHRSMVPGSEGFEDRGGHAAPYIE